MARDSEIMKGSWAVGREAERIQPTGLLVFFGHPVIGGALGVFGAVAGLIVGSDPTELQLRVTERLRDRAASVEVLAPSVLHAAWPELWSATGPLPPAVQGASQLRELIFPLVRALRLPAVLTRPAATPKILRGQLQRQPQTVIERLRSVGREGGLALQPVDSQHLIVLLERGGELMSGRCKLGLLASFGLNYEPLLCSDGLGAPGESG